MQKKFFTVITICLTIIMLGSPMTVFAEEGRYDDAEYLEVNTIMYSNMGVYEPGTYIMSSSDLPDAASNMLDIISLWCSIPIVGDKIPGCQYVEWGEKFLAIMPDTTYNVRLTDTETGDIIWEGELTSGKDELYLGDDHSSYQVEMKMKSLGVCTFVYLVQK